jgi:NADPH2:quinone reductase
MDLLITKGLYQFRPTLPFIPGHDASGIIEELGPEVDRLAVGDRVSIGVSTGAFAEEAIAPSARVVKLPDNVDLRMGAAYRASYASALYALQVRGGLTSGDRLVVTGASGGVGLAALQIARVKGVKAIGVVGSASKASAVKAEGAHAVVLDGVGSLRDAVMQHFPEGYDVALDTVGGDLTLELVRAAAWNARVLIVGFARGIPSIPANRLLLKNCALVGVNYGAAQDRDPSADALLHRTLLEWIAQGHIAPRIAQKFDLKDVAAALEMLEARAVVGKLLIQMNGESDSI